MTDARPNAGAYHCPACRSSYEGYHECPYGSDRVEYVCSDCTEHINRETHALSIKGITPGRCVSCTFDMMAGR